MNIFKVKIEIFKVIIKDEALFNKRNKTFINFILIRVGKFALLQNIEIQCADYFTFI